jgi:hypothetical protein
VTEPPEDLRKRIRIDSFEVIEADCESALTDEQRTWPVAPLRIRLDGGGLIDAPTVGETEVVIRVRCDASATPAEVSAFVEKLRSAVESVQAPVGKQFPIQIIPPSQIG